MNPEISKGELESCLQLLERLAEDQMSLSQLDSETRIRFLVAAGLVVKPAKIDIQYRVKQLRKQKHQARQKADRALRSQTKIREARTDSVFIAPPKLIGTDLAQPDPSRVFQRPQDCYICKEEYLVAHHFYDSLCPKCADFNYEKRFPKGDLTGQVALMTGARLKIGYQAALMLLRSGARVIVSTRFPQDSALRYSREPDFQAWGSRLEIYGLDLRHSPSVELFCQFISSRYDRLDHLINNAAQTVRRPPGFYRHLLETEETPYEKLPPGAQKLLAGNEECKKLLRGEAPAAGEGAQWVANWHQGRLAAPGLGASAQLSQIPFTCDVVGTDGRDLSQLFPQGKLDADLQQVDLRSMNSWRMQLADVPTDELLEVQLVNSIAPFILCAKLKPLMLRHKTGGKHVVNVSAMEGKFSRHTKTDKHPHTNMAKAALNMMTLTSAREFAKDGIYMNAVDTGWVTDEDPAELSARKQEMHDFQPPLDIVDGAARVVDPIYAGLATGKHSWGCFLKDYFPTSW